MMDKLADKWEESSFVVVDQSDPSVPVYTVRSNDNGKVRILHRNQLLRIGKMVDAPVPGRRNDGVGSEVEFDHRGERSDGEDDSSSSQGDVVEAIWPIGNQASDSSGEGESEPTF